MNDNDIDEMFRTRARLLSEIEALSAIADTTSDKQSATKARKAIEGTYAMLDVLDARIALANRELSEHRETEIGAP